MTMKNLAKVAAVSGPNLLLIVAGGIIALTIRYLMLPFESGDWVGHYSHWWKHIDQYGGFPALAHDFSDLNVTYLYLLAMMNSLSPDTSGLTEIKTISIVFDFIMAIFVYLLVDLKYNGTTIPDPPHAIMASLLVLFAPTVLFNSALWGQSDSIYTAFLLAFLYFLLSGRTILAFVAYGFAFSFKLQAIFLAPFILWIIVGKRIKYTYLFICPIVYFLSIVPAWMLGRPINELLLIYWKQTQAFSDRLSLDIANIYIWIPNELDIFVPIGLAFTVFSVVIISLFLYRRNVNLSDDVLVFLATFSVFLIPYILPRMHERYWFPADVISIVMAFYIPKYWWIPVSLWFVSTVTYIEYLTYILILPLHWLAIAPLLILFILVRHLLGLGKSPPNSASNPARMIVGCESRQSASHGVRTAARRCSQMRPYPGKSVVTNVGTENLES